MHGEDPRVWVRQLGLLEPAGAGQWRVTLIPSSLELAPIGASKSDDARCSAKVLGSKHAIKSRADCNITAKIAAEIINHDIKRRSTDV